MRFLCVRKNLAVVFIVGAVWSVSAAVNSKEIAESGARGLPLYAAHCAMCHGAKAEKTFDATKPDEQLTESVLKGIKPKMPAYEEKGVNAEQAKALVAYMKQLKQ